MNIDELRKIPVLRVVDDDALAWLATALQPRDYAEGEAVFAEGDAGESMYFIAQGSIRIEKQADEATRLNKTLTVLTAGDYFGEMALFDQKPRSASAVAAGAARLLRLSKEAFDQIQSQDSAAATKVLFAMIRTSSDRIRRLSAHLVAYDEVGKAIGEARDLQSLLDIILQQLLSAASADWGLVLLRSQFSEGLELRAEANVALTPAQRDAVGRGEGFLGPVLKNPQDHRIGDFSQYEPFASCARLGFESPSLLLCLITVEGQLLGILALGGNGVDQFDLNALNLARGVARQAGQAILNARHREEQEARSRHSRHYVRF